MSLVQLNLDANSYSDEQLRQKFRLSEHYTYDEVDVATRRLLQTAQTNLGREDLPLFRQFVNDARGRLLRERAPEYADNVEALLPSDRQLTTLPSTFVSGASLAPPPPVVHKAPVPMIQGQAPVQGQAPIIHGQAQEPVLVQPPEPMPTSSPWRDMKNRTHRVIHIDSQYRQHISTVQSDGSAGVDGVPSLGTSAFNTDFTLDLAEPLSNVLEMKLHAFHLPTTWYNFDSSMGNTAFSLETDGSNALTIDDGNYTLDELCAAVETKASDAGYSLVVSADSKSNRVTISGTPFAFYKRGGLTDEDGKVVGGSVVNQNLGWALGFRKSPDEDGLAVVDDGSQGDAPASVIGPKYFVLSIDDYNPNQQNKGLILATDDYGPVHTTRPPRMPTSQTTKAQLESQNALLLRNTNPNQRSSPPQTPNAFATLLFTDITGLRPEPYVKATTALHVYSRAYSGPTDIERLRVRLFDDKGNLVNLHDNDWSFSLLMEQLY